MLICLLLACLALPAAAQPMRAAVQHDQAAMPGCHDAPPAGDHRDKQQAAPAEHQCIGCVATWQVLPPSAEPIELRAPLPRPLPVKALAEARAGPEVPPPRA